MCNFVNCFYCQAMLEVTEHTIDVNALLQSKMGNKAGYIPSFLVNWLKRIIHEDEVKFTIVTIAKSFGVVVVGHPVL